MRKEIKPPPMGWKTFYCRQLNTNTKYYLCKAWCLPELGESVDSCEGHGDAQEEVWSTGFKKKVIMCPLQFFIYPKG
jgi:hypothetical protein